MKTKILFGLWIFLTILFFVMIGLELSNSDVNINWKKVFSIFKKKEVVVYTPTCLPINSTNFSKIALKKAVEENKIPSAINAESLGYFVVDNEENLAVINFIPDTVNYEKAKLYQEKYIFPSIVILCKEGSHLPFAYGDLNLPSYKEDVYLIKKKESYYRNPKYVVLIGDSIYLYSDGKHKFRELKRR